MQTGARLPLKLGCYPPGILGDRKLCALKGALHRRLPCPWRNVPEWGGLSSPYNTDLYTVAKDKETLTEEGKLGRKGRSISPSFHQGALGSY